MLSVQGRTRERGERRGKTNLDCLAALLGVGQQLDGECPRVLQRLLEVDEAVAPVAAHCTLTADGHRASVTVQVQHLGTRGGTGINERWGTGAERTATGVLWTPDFQPPPFPTGEQPGPVLGEGAGLPTLRGHNWLSFPTPWTPNQRTSNSLIPVSFRTITETLRRHTWWFPWIPG